MTPQEKEAQEKAKSDVAAYIRCYLADGGTAANIAQTVLELRDYEEWFLWDHATPGEAQAYQRAVVDALVDIITTSARTRS